jgi:hypothetical protein
MLLIVLAFITTELRPTFVGAALEIDPAEMAEFKPQSELDPDAVIQPTLPPLDLQPLPLAPLAAADPPSITIPDAATASDGEASGGGDGIGPDVGGGKALAASGPLLGGLGGPDVRALGPGPQLKSPGGVFSGIGEGRGPGAGGKGVGFSGRTGKTRRVLAGSTGATRQTERAVTSALEWLARHQQSDGSWSLDDFHVQCRGGTCTGRGSHRSHSAATALGVLPFLGAGQTHEARGRYQRNVGSALGWLLANQRPDGDLRCGGNMYAHGLATIALCEAFGMTSDQRVGAAAQQALNFIVAAQNKETGGWRYSPGDRGDTSVVGWQLMALKSGYMAGLRADSRAFDDVRRWLQLVDVGGTGAARFSYEPQGAGTPTMTAVALLCHQYLGAKRTDHLMHHGQSYLMANQPDGAQRNLYYWYYATQVMHNLGGTDWDSWNRKLRRTLIETQETSGCAAGSWDPQRPAKDAWGDAGGRLMTTSLAALTLEVYYRYLPLYQLDRPAQDE